MIWMNRFGNLLDEFRVSSLVLKILPCFLEPVGKAYFSYLRERHEDEELVFDFLRSRFVKKFESFRCLKIQEAFDFKYSNDGRLSEYVDKKIGLLCYVFPEMNEVDLISSTIAGMDNRQLINDFSQSISDLSAFKSQVAVYCQFNVSTGTDRESILAGVDEEDILSDCSNIAEDAREDGAQQSLYAYLRNYFTRK